MREPTTLIISSYESAELTVNLLNSIQQYASTAEDEILIMDDGSSKHTLDVLVAAKPTNCAIHSYLHQQQSGLPRLRAAGRKLAAYDWVMWLDNDVEWRYGDPLEALQNTMQSAKGHIGAIQPIRITKDNHVRQANFFDRDLNCVHQKFFEGMIQYGMYPEGACWLSHRTTFDSWQYDDTLCGFEDSDIGFQMYVAGFKCACLSTERVWHKEWGSNLWHTVNSNPANRQQVISKWAWAFDSFLGEFR